MERVERLRSGLESLTREVLSPASLAQAAVLSDRLAGEDVPQGAGSGSLGELVWGLASAEDQISLLDRLLEGASRFASRVCLFVIRADRAHGWSSVGLPEVERGDPAKDLTVSLADASILRQAFDSRRPAFRNAYEDEPGFLPPPRTGDRVPGSALAAPLVIQGKVAAILYADDGGDGTPKGDHASAEILATVAGLAASLLAFRSRPDPLEVEAKADLEVRIPAAEEGGGLAPPSDLFESDSLDDELLPDVSRTALPTGAGELSEEEERLHEDARRFARLLISELLLYNEDLVIQGRKHRDIYTRLREDIDRSRKAYDQRIPRNVSARVDYFGEELVRTLAAGDPLAMGADLEWEKARESPRRS
jgi:GAF domain